MNIAIIEGFVQVAKEMDCQERRLMKSSKCRHECLDNSVPMPTYQDDTYEEPRTTTCVITLVFKLLKLIYLFAIVTFSIWVLWHALTFEDEPETCGCCFQKPI